MSATDPPVSWGGTPGAPSGGGAPTLLATLGGVAVHRLADVIYWQGGLQIDADGSPHAYHPVSAKGLDRLANAGHPGDWWGLACNGSGFPFVQGKSAPAPGYYVSTTALADPGKFASDPRRYVDSETIPFLVLPCAQSQIFNPGGLNGAARLGDFAVVVNLANGKKAGAIVADVGPSAQIGEGSIALAQALGVPSDPRTGGCAGNLLFAVFTGSATAPAWPHTLSEINARVAGLVTQHHLNLPNLPTT